MEHAGSIVSSACELNDGLLRPCGCRGSGGDGDEDASEGFFVVLGVLLPAVGVGFAAGFDPRWGLFAVSGGEIGELAAYLCGCSPSLDGLLGGLRGDEGHGLTAHGCGVDMHRSGCSFVLAACCLLPDSGGC